MAEEMGSLGATLEEVWENIKDDILRLEKETFSLIGDKPEELQEAFIDPDSMVLVVRDAENKIHGYVLGLKPDEFDFDYENSIYIKSIAVDYESQRSGVGMKLSMGLLREAYQRGFTHLVADAMADTGYAQSLIQQAVGMAGLELVEPTPVLNPDNTINIERTLAKAEPQDYHSRAQYRIVIKLR
jgi:hypothetical protein